MLLRMYRGIVGFVTKVLDRILLVQEEPPAEFAATETDAADGQTLYVKSAEPVAHSVEDTQSLGGQVHVMRRYSDLQICIARPRNIEEAEHVGERLKRRIPVVLNLESTDEAMAQRIADYMSGAVHMVDARIAKGGRMVWVYAPVDMEIEMLKLDQDQPKAHLFADDEPAFLRDAASGTR